MGVAAQNCYKAAKGAFTGEQSPQMVLVSLTMNIDGRSFLSSHLKTDLRIRIVAQNGQCLAILKGGTCLERLTS